MKSVLHFFVDVYNLGIFFKMKNLDSNNGVIPEFVKSYIFGSKCHFLRDLERGAISTQFLLVFTQVLR